MFKKASLVILILLVLVSGFKLTYAKDSLVLMPVEMEGEALLDSEQKAYERALIESLSKKYDVYSGDTVNKKIHEISQTTSCGTMCIQETVTAFGGTLVAQANVSRSGEDYIISFEIKDVIQDQVVETKSETCPKCSKSGLLPVFKNILQSGVSGVAFVSGSFSDKYSQTKIEEISSKVSGDTASKVASLILNTEPSNAEVFLGGNLKSGTTPFQKHELQAETEILITLKRDECFDKNIKVKLKGGFNNLGTIKLLPNYGYLSIETIPSGADIILGGENIGKSPIKNHKLKYGSYLLDIKKDLYFPISNQKIEIEPETTNLQNLSLKQNFGTLNISTIEKDIKIEVFNLKNEKVLEEKVPVELKLSPDEYKIIFSKDKHHSKEYKVQIARDQTEQLENISLVAKKGTVMISTEPLEIGAKVYIDDELKGEVPFEGSLFVGNYKVKVETKYKIGEAEIKIEEGKTATKVLGLKYIEKLLKKEDGYYVNSIGMEFVLVEAGSFQMGSNDEYDYALPPHKVNITKPFYIGKYEVTKGQFRKFIEDSEYKTEAEVGQKNIEVLKGCYESFGLDDKKNKDLYWDGFKSLSSSENDPVVCISWNDAQEFLKWLNKKEGTDKYRLPTEAEWEYSAIGGNKSKGYKYAGSNDVDEVAVCFDNNSPIKLNPVGSKKANELGIYDMSGSVTEWILDSHVFNLKKFIEDDPIIIIKEYNTNVVRDCCSWVSGCFECGVKRKNGYWSHYRNYETGFRLVLTF